MLLGRAVGSHRGMMALRHAAAGRCGGCKRSQPAAQRRYAGSAPRAAARRRGRQGTVLGAIRALRGASTARSQLQLLQQCNQLLSKGRRKAARHDELRSAAAVGHCQPQHRFHPLSPANVAHCSTHRSLHLLQLLRWRCCKRQVLLADTTKAGGLLETADVYALCELLELSRRLFTRDHSPASPPLRREVVGALVALEDSMTHAAVARTAQVRAHRRVGFG